MQAPEKVPEAPRVREDLIEIIIQVPAKKMPAPPAKKQSAAA